jgi:hypothetical protein
MSPVPCCPRCSSSAFVVRGGLTGYSWICLSCLQKSAHLDAAIRIWRVWVERGTDRPIRVTRRAA